MTAVRHLYLHMPFCRRRCPYCDYPVVADPSPDPSRWTWALAAELRLQVAAGLDLSRPDTLLVGGGTPSCLGAGLTGAVEAIVGGGRLSRLSEWTVEANPEDIDDGLLERWWRAGVTRVHIGVQSLRAGVLEWLGRGHAPAAGLAAIVAARRAGFWSWGVDVLFGLPPEIDPGPVATLKRVIDAGVPHVSIHELALEPGTPLSTACREGRFVPADADLVADQYIACHEVLEDAGYEPYEMTSFARPSHRPRHMPATLGGAPWLGLGPGAHSRIRGRAVRNLREWRGYLGALQGGKIPVSEAASVDPRSPEAFWCRLRLADGIPRSELGAVGRRLADAWTASGLARDARTRLRLAPAGWLRLDELADALARAERGSRGPDRAGPPPPGRKRKRDGE